MLQTEAQLQCDGKKGLNRTSNPDCPSYWNNHDAIAHLAPKTPQGQLPSQDTSAKRAKAAAADFVRYRDVRRVPKKHLDRKLIAIQFQEEVFYALKVDPRFKEEHAGAEGVRKILHDNYKLLDRKVAISRAAAQIWKSIKSAEKDNMQEPPTMTARTIIPRSLVSAQARTRQAQGTTQRQVY